MREWTYSSVWYPVRLASWTCFHLETAAHSPEQITPSVTSLRNNEDELPCRCFLSKVLKLKKKATGTHLEVLRQATFPLRIFCFVLLNHHFEVDVCGWLIPKVAEAGIDLLRIRRIRLYLSETVEREWILFERLEGMLKPNEHEVLHQLLVDTVFEVYFILL